MAKYPLEQVAIIKQKRLDEAERLLKERKAELEKEEATKKKLEEDRDLSKKHKIAKLDQLRESMDEGSDAVTIQGMKDYLKVVDAELKAKEIKVDEQEKKVKEAQEKVEEARKEMVKKQHDVEKLAEHKKGWQKEVQKLLEEEEAKTQDEIGTIRYMRKGDG